LYTIDATLLTHIHGRSFDRLWTLSPETDLEGNVLWFPEGFLFRVPVSFLSLRFFQRIWFSFDTKFKIIIKSVNFYGPWFWASVWDDPDHDQ